MKIQVQESQSEEQILASTLLGESVDNLSDEGQLEKSTLHHTWFMRTFGPMKKGSLRQSVIALMCTAMGSGMLAFPSNPRESGLGAALIIMVISALLSRFSMYLLMKTAFSYNIKSYSELVKHTFGQGVQRFYFIDVILYTFGAMVGYQIIFIQFATQVYDFFKFDPQYHNYIQYFGGLAFMALNLPVSFLRDLYSLRYFTHLQILIIAYICGAIIVYFFTNITDFDYNKIVWFKFDLNLTCTFAATFFGFICHQLIFPIRSELRRASFKRMSKIFNRAICFETLIYIALMSFGYLSFFDETKDIIVDNYTDLAFTFAKALFSLILFFAVPINLNPSRLTILQLINKEESNKAYIIITLALQITTGGVAMAYPQVKSIFGLLGGVFGMIMVVVLPCCIFIKLQLNEDKKWTDKPIIFTAIVGILAGGAGFTGAILSQFKS